MNAKDAIRSAANMSQMVLSKYLDDLDDADLMRRPSEGCNHLAWQLGHLISSEKMLLESLAPGAGPDLPEGFAEKHSKETIDDDNAANFCKKQEYLDLWQKVREASLAALDKLPESDLDGAAPEHFRSMFPTAGDVWMLVAMHGLMHSGQFVPVRRTLGKPVVI